MRINHNNHLMKSLRIVVSRVEVRPHTGKAARELLPPSEIKGSVRAGHKTGLFLAALKEH